MWTVCIMVFFQACILCRSAADLHLLALHASIATSMQAPSHRWLPCLLHCIDSFAGTSALTSMAAVTKAPGTRGLPMMLSYRDPSMNTLWILTLSFTSTKRSFSVTMRSPGETCISNSHTLNFSLVDMGTLPLHLRPLEARVCHEMNASPPSHQLLVHLQIAIDPHSHCCSLAIQQMHICYELAWPHFHCRGGC